MTDTLIRQRVEDLVKAIRSKDIDRAVSFYTSDIVSFDLDPPLRYAGIERKRRAWQALFAAYKDPLAYETRELDITTHDGLAFVHSLNHVSGTLASGHVTDMWVRWTACFRQIDGAWLIVHDHVSVPADLAHGRAAVDLEP